jgi:hypothetical protein
MPAGGGFFVFIWFVMMIGMVVGWIVFLVAVCRMAKAHEQISETLGIALLGKRPKPPTPEQDSSEPAECMKCQGTIPAGQTKCPQCGWSYEMAPNETAERFKEQRGF